MSLVFQCWSALQNLSQSNVVELVWVPGHLGIEGNEKADELARTGSGTPLCGPEPCLPIPAKMVQFQTKEWATKTHSLKWQDTIGCNQSKNWLIRPRLKNTQYFLGLSRNQLRLVLSLITGHCKLNSHLHKMGLHPEPKCERCHLEAETAEHFICRCPCRTQLRIRIFGKPMLNEAEYSAVSASDILSFALSSKRFNPN
jgi:hypothetical protein